MGQNPWESPEFAQQNDWSLWMFNEVHLPKGFTIWLFNIANWKIHYKWRFIAGRVICKWAISIAMSNNQRVSLM
jgi:hypothetical protein